MKQDKVDKRQDAFSEIFTLCEDAERQLQEKRNAVVKEKVYMKKHNFNMEFNALEYKEEAFSEADYILFQLKLKIHKLIEAEE